MVILSAMALCLSLVWLTVFYVIPVFLEENVGPLTARVLILPTAVPAFFVSDWIIDYFLDWLD